MELAKFMTHLQHFIRMLNGAKRLNAVRHQKGRKDTVGLTHGELPAEALALQQKQ